MRPTAAVPNEFSGAVLEEYVKIIRVKAQYYGIQVLDLYSAASLHPSDQYYAELIREDGIHPNDQGHEIIARELLQFLEKVRVAEDGDSEKDGSFEGFCAKGNIK